MLALLGVTLFFAGNCCLAKKTYDSTKDDRYRNIFLRAKKDTPSEEFKYAQKLQKRGRKRSARRHYKAVVKHWPTSLEAPDAQLEIARMLDKKGKKSAAFDACQVLFDRYPGRFPAEEILKQQFRLANEVMEKKKMRILFGGLPDPEAAVPLFEKIVKNAPEWERTPEAQYLIGKAYEDSNTLEMAVPAYHLIELEYPDSPLAPEAAFRKCRLLSKLSEKKKNDNELMEKAFSAAALFVAQYPDSEYFNAAVLLKKRLYDRRAVFAFKSAKFYDNIKGKENAALTAYQRMVKHFPDSTWTAKAKQRIVVLEILVGDQDEKI